MIEGQGLEYAYQGGSAMKFPDFKFDQGSQWLVLGKSGSGKSTLLQILAGLRIPSSGSIAIDGQQLKNLNAKDLDNYRGQKIGIVFQKAHFVESISILENLLLAQYLSGKEQNKKRCLELLGRLGLQEKANRLPSQLSQGERQRVSLARALAKSPKVLLADEPSSALDDANTDSVIQLLQKEAKQADATLIIVTHDQRLKNIFSHKIELT